MCYSPIRVKMPNGGIQKVPCGKCLACLNKKANRYKTLCMEEAQQYRYIMFVTLTYKNEFVPRANVFWNKVNKNEYYLCVKNDTERLSKYYESNHIASAYVTQSELDKIELTFKTHKYAYFKENQIPYAAFIDARNFIKRFRTEISRQRISSVYEEDTTIRYYCCSEYGPQTFRPHFHILFYFNSEALYYNFNNLVRKTWKFGRFDCKLSTGSASNYCAAYTSANSLISPLHAIPSIRPRSTHSRHFGKEFDEILSKGDFALRFEHINARTLAYDGRIKLLPPSLSLEVSLFPKCYGFSMATSHQRFVRYTALSRCRKYFPGEHTLKELASLTYDFLNTQIRHNDKLSLGPAALVLGEAFQECNRDPEVYYRILCVSSHFLRNANAFNKSPEEYFAILEDYYNDKESFMLRSFYNELQGQRDLRIQMSKYANIPSSAKDPIQHVFQEESTLRVIASSFGYDNVAVFLSDNEAMLLPENNPELEEKRILARKIFYDNIKHKEQNEANGIFLDDDELISLYNNFY